MCRQTFEAQRKSIELTQVIMDGVSDAVALLDVTKPGWPMLFANEGWRQVTGGQGVHCGLDRLQRFPACPTAVVGVPSVLPLPRGSQVARGSARGCLAPGAELPLTLWHFEWQQDCQPQAPGYPSLPGLACAWARRSSWLALTCHVTLHSTGVFVVAGSSCIAPCSHESHSAHVQLA